MNTVAHTEFKEWQALPPLIPKIPPGDRQNGMLATKSEPGKGPGTPRKTATRRFRSAVSEAEPATSEGSLGTKL